MGDSEGATRREFFELATMTAAAVVIAGAAGPAGATPPSGKVTRTPLAQGRIEERLAMNTAGPSDFYIQLVALEPGADTGWHSHPGFALDIVKSGALTWYLEGVECTGQRVKAGEAFFVAPGVTHLARNEGSEPAEAYITYLVAAGATPRAEAPKPEGCR
jgi:quercetin dioxygenase-like cupin family protein